jgi:hypothetical protein
MNFIGGRFSKAIEFQIHRQNAWAITMRYAKIEPLHIETLSNLAPLQSDRRLSLPAESIRSQEYVNVPRTGVASSINEARSSAFKVERDIDVGPPSSGIAIWHFLRDSHGLFDEAPTKIRHLSTQPSRKKSGSD